MNLADNVFWGDVCGPQLSLERSGAGRYVLVWRLKTDNEPVEAVPLARDEPERFGPGSFVRGSGTAVVNSPPAGTTRLTASRPSNQKPDSDVDCQLCI